MRTAAMTRFSHNKTLLEMWLKYYSKYFDDLIVFACVFENYNPTDEMGELKYKFEIITAPSIYSLEAHWQVFQKQIDLLNDHEWVLYSDIDEFVIPRKGTLKGFMKRSKDKQTFCSGYEVFMNEDETPIKYGNPPILKQRKFWYKDASGSYNKPALSRIKSNWVVGFHKLGEMADEDIKAIESPLYMVHLKHIDSDVVQDNKSRKEEIPEKIRRTI